MENGLLSIREKIFLWTDTTRQKFYRGYQGRKTVRVGIHQEKMKLISTENIGYPIKSLLSHTEDFDPVFSLTPKEER